MAKIDLTTFFTRSLTTKTLFPGARSKERNRISTLSSLSLSPPAEINNREKKVN
jgi:hypothetical protein